MIESVTCDENSELVDGVCVTFEVSDSGDVEVTETVDSAVIDTPAEEETVEENAEESEVIVETVTEE